MSNAKFLDEFSCASSRRNIVRVCWTIASIASIVSFASFDSTVSLVHNSMGCLCHIYLAHSEHLSPHFPFLLDLFRHRCLAIWPHSTRLVLYAFVFCSVDSAYFLNNVSLFSGVGSGFESFPRTFLTLGNLVTGENWNSLFDDVSIEYP